MPNFRASPFDLFCRQRKTDLQRIARHTRGELELEDVENEAWLMADALQRKRGMPIDWTNDADQELLLSHLYQHLVRYTEQHVRHAIRLDHSAGEQPDDAPHPLLGKLAASERSDPLAALLAEQEAREALQQEPHCHHSLASAYVHLLRRFDNRMRAVADHLLISLSYCYRRYAHVKNLAERQHPIPIQPVGSPAAFVPGAWRKYRLRRAPVQLAFDFECEPPLALASS